MITTTDILRRRAPLISYFTEEKVISANHSNLLPIDPFIPEILQRIASENNLVITAQPGAGKTTRLPPALLSTVKGKIVVLQPRRMAAIAAAHRIAEENNWRVGEEVGYQVRFINKTSSKTRLIFMTEALLTRHLINDPKLEDIDMVILDEFHERSLHVDLALGLLHELQLLSQSLKIVVMSATLDAEKISSYLGNCPIFTIPGKLFPLEIRYQKTTPLFKNPNKFYENLIRLIHSAQTETVKNILVFLPGIKEIENTKQRLLIWANTNNIEIISLHGSLPLEMQRKALQKSSRQRIILSTNIAESSVTLDGVNIVIDSGLAKIMKQDLRTGFSRLELARINLSSAMQRAGRAARQFPGMCYRMWTQADEQSFIKFDIPEILRSDLSDHLLFLAAQGIRNFENFSWFEKPPKVNIDRAIQILQSMGGLSSNNELLTIGQQLLLFPLPVRLARLLIAGMENDCIDLAAKMAALLNERDILDIEESAFECDLSLRLEVLNQFLKNKTTPAGSDSALQLVFQSYQQLLQLIRQVSKKFNFNLSHRSYSENEARQMLLLFAFGDRLCRRRKNTDRGLMVGGRGIKLSSQTSVKTSTFFIALDGIESTNETETLVTLASGIEENFLLNIYANQILKKKEIFFDAEKNQFYQQEFQSLWDLPLEQPTLSLATAAQVTEKIPQILVDNWNNTLKNNSHLEQWWQRISFLRTHLHFLPMDQQNELLDIFDDGFLKKSFCLQAFSQACMNENKISNVLKKNLVFYFENNLTEALKRTLEIELPTQIKVPSGSKIPIHYSSDKPPYLEVRIQEIFGWTKTPMIAFEKVPIVLHLLAPNFRPMQITSNLESFWKDGYLEARKELQIRYPKHQWPENPFDGIAEAKGRRRR